VRLSASHLLFSVLRGFLMYSCWRFWLCEHRWCIVNHVCSQLEKYLACVLCSHRLLHPPHSTDTTYSMCCFVDFWQWCWWEMLSGVVHKSQTPCTLSYHVILSSQKKSTEVDALASALLFTVYKNLTISKFDILFGLSHFWCPGRAFRSDSNRYILTAIYPQCINKRTVYAD